jgi:hypothetical protein
LSGPDSPEQARAASPFDSAPQGWVPNPLQHRDSVRAGRERYGVDIQGASGFVFDYIEGRIPYPGLGEDQQIYDDDDADLEPSLRTRTRRTGGRRNHEVILTTEPTIMPSIDSNDVFRNGGLPIAPAVNASSCEQTRTEDGNGRCSSRADSSGQIRQRPASGSLVPRRGQSMEARPASQNSSKRSLRGFETPRVPTKGDSVSPARMAPVFDMSERQRSEWKRKGIDPNLMYEGT